MDVADGARVRCPHCHKQFIIEFRRPKQPVDLPKKPRWDPYVADPNPRVRFMAA